MKPSGATLPVVALLVSLAAVAHSSAGAPRPAPGYEPDVEAASGARFEDGKWICDGGAVRIELLPVDGAARGRFIAMTTGLAEDPFAPSGASTSRYLTWVLVLDNRSNGEVSFQSQAARLVASDGAWTLPLDLAAIQEAYASLDRETPEHLMRLDGAIFDGEEIVPVGKARAGLLAYRTTKLVSKKFFIEISVTNLRGEATECSFPYRKARRR